MKKILKPAGIIILSALILEIFIFNFRFWQSRGYGELSVPLDTVIYAGAHSGLSDGSVLLNEAEGNNVIQIDLRPAGVRIRNAEIKLYCAEDTEYWYSHNGEMYAELSSKACNVTPLVTKGEENRLMKRKLMGGADGKNDILWLPSGMTAELLTMRISGIKGDDAVLCSVTLNKQAGMDISILRLIAVMAAFSFAYLFRPASGLWGLRLFNEERKDRSPFASIVITGVLMLLFFGFLLSRHQVYLQGEGGFHPYRDLAHAIAAGQLYLQEEPPAELAGLADPYDPVERLQAGISYQLDYAYFEGKYYIYFGIVPCLVFYLPVYLLTGADIPGYVVFMILEALMITGCGLLVYRLCERYRKGCSIASFLLLWILAVSASGLFGMSGDASNYYVPMASGIVLWLFAMCGYLRAGKETGKKYGFIVLSSVMMALVAGCRPQLILGGICALPVLFDIVFPATEGKRRTDIKALLCFSLPYIPVAAGLMLYNMLRFGSVTEFGSSYNLTYAYVTDSTFYPERFLPGLYYYLFRPWTTTDIWPYISERQLEWSNPGLLANHISMGGIYCLFPALAVMTLLLLVKDENKKKESIYTGGAFFAAAVLICMADALKGGLMSRYRMDMMIFAAAAAVTGTLGISSGKKENAVRLMRLGLAAGTASVILMAALTYGEQGLNELMVVNTDWRIALENAVEFWR